MNEGNTQMSADTIKAYQGQPFTITLRSYGGTNYSWCLTTLPQGIALAFVYPRPVAPGSGAPVDHAFTFLAVGSDTPVKVGFKLLCLSEPKEDAKEIQFKVEIVPDNKDGFRGFIRYSENTATYNIPPGDYNACTEKYGYPCVEYGYPGVVKYGYMECESYPPPFKYGYPCVSYGYVECESYSPPMKYGYPCVEYGYPDNIKCRRPDCR